MIIKNNCYSTIRNKKIFYFKILQWIGIERSDVCNPILIKNFNFLIKDKEFTNLWENILKHLGDYDLIFLIISFPN